MKGALLNIMSYTFSLGKISGIPFKMHWSVIPFFAIIPFIAQSRYMSGVESLLLLALMILIFFSVLLHELGHAGAARRLGVKTHDILLSPIGGIARLEQMPEDPMEEFKIAIAGPLVNLLIFSIIAIPLAILAYTQILTIDISMQDLRKPIVFISLFAISNFALFLFNLVPAFPMDGGRILRAFLASRMGRAKATFIASVIGKILAFGLIIVGALYFRPIYSLIGIFVFMMADMENRQEKETVKLKAISAGRICSQNYTLIRMFTPMQDVIRMHFDNGETNFLVTDSSNKVTGIIYQAMLDDAMRVKENEQPASNYLTTRFAIVNVNDNLIHVYDELIKNDMPLALVMDYGEIYGIIDRNLLADTLDDVKKGKIVI